MIGSEHIQPGAWLSRLSNAALIAKFEEAFQTAAKFEPEKAGDGEAHGLILRLGRLSDEIKRREKIGLLDDDDWKP